MLSARTTLRALTLLAVIAITAPPASGQVLNRFRLRRADKVQTLAKKLDQVQSKIDEYGSVVAKSPDVWGESRLMRHRADVEQELKDRIGRFEVRTNARQATRDSAFLAQAFAVQQMLAQLQERTETSGEQFAFDANGLPTRTTTDETKETFTQPSFDPDSVTAGLIRDLGTGDFISRGGYPAVTNPNDVEIEPVVELDQLNRYLQHLMQLRRGNEGDDTADAPGYSLNLIRFPVSVLPGRRTRMGYGAEVEFTIEPEFSDELLPIAFRDFVINGTKNRIAHQVFNIATTSAMKELEDALERYYANATTEWSGPEVFAIYKHVVSLVSLDKFPPEFKALENVPKEEQVKAAQSVYVELARVGRAYLRYSRTDLHPRLSNNAIRVLKKKYPREFEEADKKREEYDQAVAKQRKLESDLVAASSEIVEQGFRPFLAADLAADGLDSTTRDLYQKIDVEVARAERNFSKSGKQAKPAKEERRAAYESKRGILRGLVAQRSVVMKSALDADAALKQAVEAAVKKSVEMYAERLLRQPLATTYVPTVDYTSLAPSFTDSVNGHTLQVVAHHIFNQLVVPGLQGKEVVEIGRAQNGLTYPATEEVLLSELKAAYTFLTRPNAEHLWTFCSRQLADSILEHRRSLTGRQFAAARDRYQLSGGANPADGVHALREEFFKAIAQDFPQAKGSVVASLAWHIIVESALLNDRLIRDIKETAAGRPCRCLSGEHLDFAGPHPTQEARDVFEEYVKCRWPIRVFTLDPVTQDQNVSDTFSRRRELQVVLALAASNRLLGAQSLTEYARRLEYDLETIALNRTAVGFSHDNDSFGWRFYPRIQAPPVPGHFRASLTQMFGRGLDADSRLKQSKLESGIRECTALVVMPSFLPHVRVETRTNWFPLGGQKRRILNVREPGYRDSVNLSREIMELRTLASTCKSDAHLYRGGEVVRLCKAVDRLDKRLPLQTYDVEVPWENTLGGFEIFNTGKTTLKPQLLGWYGAPGIAVNDLGGMRAAAASVEQRTREASVANLNYQRSVARGDAAATQAVEKAKSEAARLALAEAQKVLDQINVTNGATRVFLVGKNFSVLDTEVIAGGVDVTNSVRLLSRNLMSVLIPSSVSTIQLERRKAAKQRHVVVNLMTPYGAASNRLLIPVHDSGAAAAKQAADAAKAAADAAVKKHVSDAHPVSYKIDDAPKKEIAATLIYKNAVIEEFKIQSGVGQTFKVENGEGKDMDELLNSGVLKGPRAGEIAFRVTAKSNKATTKEKKLKAGPYPFTVGQKVPIDQVLIDVKQTIETPGNLIYNFDPKEIELQPYVRFNDPAQVGDRTIFKVSGTVKIVMNSEEKKP